MDMFSIMEKVGTLFALIIIGLVFGKLARTTEKDTQLLAKVVLNVVVPANIIASVRMEDFDSIKQDLLALVIISCCVLAVTLALAFLFTRLLKMEGATAAVYRSAVFFNNYGFMGWPVCFIIFGAQGLLYAVLYTIPMNVFLYTFTPMMLADKTKRAFDLKLLINMPLVSTVIAVLLLVFRATPPDLLGDVFEMVGAVQTPLSMMIVGMVLASADLKKLMNGAGPYLYSAVRLVVIPAALFLFLKWAGVFGLVLGIPVIIAAMPAATMVVVLSQNYDSDTVLASRLVIISTLFSIVTIPLFAMLVL